jgi:hypothetical protein
VGEREREREKIYVTIKKCDSPLCPADEREREKLAKLFFPS